MKFSALNPYVRFAHIVLHSSKRTEPVCAYDHRLFFILENACHIETDTAAFDLHKNDLLLLPPALPYTISGDEEVACKMVLLNYDLDTACPDTHEHPPDPADAFDSTALFSPLRLAPFDAPLCQKSCFQLREDLEQMVLTQDSNFPDDVLSAKMKLILLSCAALVQEKTLPSVLDSVRSYLDGHFIASPTNQEVAEAFHYHPYYLNQLFRTHFGMTMHDYVADKKLEYASRLLLSTDWSISRIAEAAGFCSAAWFAEQFKVKKHLSPTQFRSLKTE